MSLYRQLKEWRKNPHWSFSCCVAFLVPLKDLEKESFGLIGTDELNDSQLHAGQTEVQTTLSAVRDSGTVDVSLGEGLQGVDKPIVTRDANCEDSNDKPKCHKAIQTKLVLPFTTAEATM